MFTLNLRSHALGHLCVADQDNCKKKEHETRALKRQTIEILRQGAPAGRKVLYICDRAGIDFPPSGPSGRTAVAFTSSPESQTTWCPQIIPRP
jgi:hypothetical protein